MTPNQEADENRREAWQRPPGTRGPRGVAPRPPGDVDRPGETLRNPLEDARADPNALSQKQEGDKSAVGTTYGGLRSTPHAADAPTEPYLHITAHDQLERDTDQVGEARERGDGTAQNGERS